jgi:hypothetical protein
MNWARSSFPVVLQICRDPGAALAVAADFGFDASSERPAPGHLVDIGLVNAAVSELPISPVDGAEEGSVLFVCDAVASI